MNWRRSFQDITWRLRGARFQDQTCLAMRLLHAVCLIALLWGRVSASADELANRIGKILAEPVYASAHWGLLVVDAHSGETRYEWNPDQLFVPASTTKLFTV